MVTVNDLYIKVCARMLTATDVVELFSESTVTDGVPHPPHPHAHLAADGFRYAIPTDYYELKSEKDFLLGKINTKYNPRRIPADMQKWKKRHTVVSNKIDALLKKPAEEMVEGQHLDPATRTKFPIENRIVDPTKSYIKRARHSQFEDSESAILALAYALNCAAGEAALYALTPGWGLGTMYDRVVIASRTAVNGLSLPIRNRGKSSHSLRNKPIGMIERGAGSAGNAPTTKLTVGRVMSVLDRDTHGNLILVTHYPVNTPIKPGQCNILTGHPPAIDYIEQKIHHGASNWKSIPAITPPPIRWDEAISAGLSGSIWRLLGY